MACVSLVDSFECECAASLCQKKKRSQLLLHPPTYQAWHKKTSWKIHPNIWLIIVDIIGPKFSTQICCCWCCWSFTIIARTKIYYMYFGRLRFDSYAHIHGTWTRRDKYSRSRERQRRKSVPKNYWHNLCAAEKRNNFVSSRLHFVCLFSLPVTQKTS